VHVNSDVVEANGFVVLSENRAGCRAVRRLVNHLTKIGSRSPFPSLFLHGITGTGKTHLVRDLIEQVIPDRPSFTAQSVAAVDVDRWLQSPSREAADTLQELRECDLLVVEDAQHLSSRSSDELANLLDHRQNRKRPFVTTSAVGPAELELPARLRSRFASGLVVHLEPLGNGSRRKLAKQFLADRRIVVESDVLKWLCGQGNGGVRPILGGVHRLEVVAKQFAPPLTWENVQTALIGEPVDEAPAIERIASRVSEFYRVKLKQMLGPARQRQTLWARQVAMHLTRQLTPLSLVQIGSYFGGRDHSTVLHACQKIESCVSEDPSIATDIRRLQAELG